MRVASLTAIAIGAMLATTLPSYSFGTVNFAEQNAEHEKITRLALQSEGFEPHSLNEIAGTSGTWGAVGSPDNPARLLSFKEYAHCDGGDYIDLPGYPHSKDAARKTLEECRAWIFGNLNNAVRAASGLLDGEGRIRSMQIPTIFSCTYLGTTGRAKCNVLEALGTAFHASQDFYSHSNWTDKVPNGPLSPRNPPNVPSARNPPQQPEPIPAPWLDPTQDAPFPVGLMTGCYEGLDENDPKNCIGRTRHADLNKDKGAIDLVTGPGKGSTPRGKMNENFERAVTVAAQDTLAKWTYFKSEVIETYDTERGNRIICAIRRDNPAETCP